MNINLYEIRLEESITIDFKVLDAFFFDCQCALFFVDMTNDKSLNSIKDIIPDIDDDKYPYLKKIIVENKSDINPGSINNDLQSYMNTVKNIDHIKISVKTGDNLDELLSKIFREITTPQKKSIPVNNVAKCSLKDLSKEKFEGSFSLILVGNTNVGKTNFMTRYAKNVFKTLFLSNFGVNTEITSIKINNRDSYQLTLWDTAGQERYRSLPRKYYRNIDGVLLLFDVNEKDSFKDVSVWMGEINEHADRTDEGGEETNKEAKGPIIYLIGNKIDLIENGEKRIVSREEGEELAKKLGVKYFEVSCKWNLNIEEVMARIIMDCFKEMRPRAKTIQIKRMTTKKKEGCCLKQNDDKKNKNKK